MGRDMLHKIRVVTALEPDAYGTGTRYSAPIDTDDYLSCGLVASCGTFESSATNTVSVEEADAPSRIVDDSEDPQDTQLVLDNGAGDNTELGVQFTTPNTAGSSVTQVDVMLKRVGSPDGNATVTLQADSTDTPDDTDLITPVAVAVSALSTSVFTKVEFVFPTAVHLAGNTKYWVVIESTYTPSSSDHVVLGIDTVGSGGNISIHDADWGSLVTTQVGLVNVHAHDWSAVSGATTGALAQGTDDDKTFTGSIDLANRKRYLRAKQVVATDAVDSAVHFLLGMREGGLVTQEQTAKFQMA